MRYILSTSLSLFFLSGCLSPNTMEPFTLPTITITNKTQTWHVEVAKTQEERSQGLMFRDSLEPGTGMLFVFPEEDFHAFWMKNTRIPLDIIWLDNTFTVIDIQTLIPCKETVCPTVRPQKPAQYVLEVPAHTFTGSIGDQLKEKKEVSF